MCTTNYTMHMGIVKSTICICSLWGCIYLIHLTTWGLLFSKIKEKNFCFPKHLLTSPREKTTQWGNCVPKSLCIWSRWNSGCQWEMSEISHHDTREVTSCAALEISLCTSSFLHLVCKQHRDYMPRPSQAADRSENCYQKKKKILDSGYLRGGLFSKCPAERDTGVTCRHTCTEPALAGEGQCVRCTESLGFLC